HERPASAAIGAEGRRRHVDAQPADKKNALSIAVRDEMSDALDDLAGDEAVKTVVITGAGEVFSAGFDLREFQQPELTDRLWASSDRFHATVLRFPLPLVAAVNGPAIAGGFDLAVMSDVRVAAETARFSHPEIEFGDVVYGPLHDLVGGGLARELCFTGRVVDAEEAKTLGLVSSVVPVDELADEVTRFTDMIARAPRDVLLRTKAKAIRRARVAESNTLEL
ncbi:MAG TPA: enoyl-CoA hydratase/isomerase family protein, partial [Acidimicrobiia bacterium]|nr:enoyl-CoA hydratase/isomerase family protein [Acidimicrobiia bacterium]